MKLIQLTLYQFLGVFLFLLGLILLNEQGLTAGFGWQMGSILLLASGVFCIRVFIEIIYLTFKAPEETPVDEVPKPQKFL